MYICSLTIMMGYIKAQSLVFLQKKKFSNASRNRQFRLQRRKKSFSLQFSTIVCAHEEWQRFQQFLNIPKEFLFTILDNFFHYLLLNSLQKLE